MYIHSHFIDLAQGSSCTELLCMFTDTETCQGWFFLVGHNAKL